MITCKSLSCGYGKSIIFNELNLNFTPKKMTALIGENGCGKSTLLKAIMGFIPIGNGAVMISDNEKTTDLHKINPKKRAQLISYLPQHTSCPDYLTVAELIELGRYAYGSRIFNRVSKDDKERFIHTLELVRLADMAHRPVNSLSGGQRQRAWIAMIIAQDSDIILLDEPVNHLDVRHQYSILALVREIMMRTNKTVITVLHDLNQASVFADEICLLKQGVVIAHDKTNRVMTHKNIKKGFNFDSNFVSQSGRVFCVPDVTEYLEVLP